MMVKPNKNETIFCVIMTVGVADTHNRGGVSKRDGATVVYCLDIQGTAVISFANCVITCDAIPPCKWTGNRPIIQLLDFHLSPNQ